MSEDTKTIGGFEVEEYKNNLTLILGEDTPVRLAMTSDGKKLFLPEDFKGKKSYGGYAIIEDKAQKKGIQEVVDYLIEKHLDGEAPDEDKYNALKVGDDCVYKKGDNKGEIFEGFEGNLAIKFKKSELRNDGSPNDTPEVYSSGGDLIESYPDKRVFKDGCYGRVQVRLYAYEYEGIPVIGCDFDAVLYTDKGERIESKGGGVKVDKSKLFKGHDVDAGVDDRNDVFGKGKKKDKKKKKNK